MALLLAAVLLSGTLAAAYDNGLARTPQMGWNNWNALGCRVSEDLLLDTAQKLLDFGLRDVGYEYVVLDDCWSGGRGPDGKLFADENKFPSGMKAISDKIHDMRLLFGMYSSAGEMTCAKYPGSLDWEQQDAQTFASWGVDYLKYDNCFSMGRHGSPHISYQRFKAMSSALNDTGRPILYSLCSWGEDLVHTWGVSIANSWRISGDIYDSFSRPDVFCSCNDNRDALCINYGSHCSVLYILNKVAPYTDRGMAGGWNDLDMLEVGHGGMTDDEYKAHFAMWAILKSPLLIGADLRTLPASALTILNNPAIIALNQDAGGHPAHRISVRYDVKKDRFGVGETQVWTNELFKGDQVVAFLNAADEDVEISSPLEDIFVSDGPGGSSRKVGVAWDVHDLWASRMSNEVAEQLIMASNENDQGALDLIHREANWYNSTQTPYGEGMDQGDWRLLGRKVKTVEAGGVLSEKVRRHSAAIFRLRPALGEDRRSAERDEL